MENDIHNYVRRYQRCIKRVEESNLSKKTKKIIISFAKNCKRNISYPATVRYILAIHQISNWIGKDIENITIDDVDDLVDNIKAGKIKKKNGQKYSFDSIRNYKISLKMFLKYIGKEDLAGKISAKKKKVQLNINDLWTEEEIYRLLDVIPDLQDRAMAAVTIEGALRIGETANMTISSVIKKQGKEVLIQVTGKTGPRTIMLIWSSYHLLKWIDSHPSKDKKNSSLWIYKDGSPRKYGSFARVFKKAKKDCGIDKPANPHNFRKSMTTILRRKGYDIELIKRRNGWARSSTVMEHYEAIDDKALFNEERRINGIDIENTKAKPNSKPCPFCSVINQATAIKCQNCHKIIDMNERERIMMAELRENIMSKQRIMVREEFVKVFNVLKKMPKKNLGNIDNMVKSNKIDKKDFQSFINIMKF